MATVNPPKKHKYSVQPVKNKTGAELFVQKLTEFFTLNKKLIIIVTAAVLAAAMLITALIVGLNYYFIDTPYDGVRFKDHITVPDYMNRELSAAKVKEEFEAQKKALLKTQATYETLKSGLIEEGNNVTISTEGFIVNEDGTETKVSRGTLTDYEITDIGNHITEKGLSFSDEIQDALIGTSVVSVKRVTANISYPEDYSMSEFAGQTVKYYITVSKVTKTILPEYTDATVAKLDKRFSTVKEYEDYTYRQIKQDLLWTQLVNDTTATSYPESKLKIYMDEYDAYYNSYMEQNKVTFEKLLAELGSTAEEYEKQRRIFAENTVKEEMILYYIIKTEKVRVSAKEFDSVCETIAKNSGYQTVDMMLLDYGEELVERTVIWEKVKAMILENATEVE
ncbi:MAG: hypothetical protein E7634_05300 [Ruminococcaceae bacterium]|nr:hypothetical protein [Oscillospiraceae bacterium]